MSLLVALLLVVSVVGGAAAAGRLVDLNQSKPSYTILGAASKAFLSEYMQTGDFNGDGKIDVLVSATAQTHNGGYTGAVYLILGRATPPTNLNLASASADLTIYGAAAKDAFGHALASGDVNGDGIADMVISADRNNGERGAVYVFLGHANLGNPPAVIDMANPGANAPALTITGAAPGWRLGRSLASGDLNKDGVADIAIGAYLASPGGRTEAGAVYVVSGSPTLSATTPITQNLATTPAMLTIYGKSGAPAPVAALRPQPLAPASLADETKVAAEFGDRLGHAVAFGDVNNDATVDLVTGSYGANPGGQVDAGEVYVFYGANTFTATTPITIDLFTTPTAPNHTLTGVDAGDQAGFTLAAANIGATPPASLLVGAYFSQGMGNAAAETGEIYLVNGGPGLAAVSSLAAAARTFYGVDGGDRLGRSLAFGDVSGDGQRDLILGASRADPGGRIGAGAVYVIYSGTSATGALHLDNTGGADLTLLGASTGGGICLAPYEPSQNCSDELGFAVTSGDVNNDGVDDVLGGAVYVDNGVLADAGAVYVVFGGAPVPTDRQTFLPNVPVIR
jgi:hypothetical protein